MSGVDDSPAIENDPAGHAVQFDVTAQNPRKAHSLLCLIYFPEVRILLIKLYFILDYARAQSTRLVLSGQIIV
jgi:hypothetical protein